MIRLAATVSVGILPVAESSADAALVAEHLDRLLKSDLLRRSASLSHLLQYLVDKALQADGEHLKESIIAIDVFHRSGEFDSRVDNIVRVHAHRLRKLLETWYAGEGAHEKIRFVIPRGGYMLRIEQHQIEESEPESVSAPPERIEFKPAAEPVRPRRPITLLAGALALGMALGGGTVYGILSHVWLHPAATEPAATENDALTRPPLSALWKSVFRHGTDTVVSFTNPAFLRTKGSPRLYITYHGPLNAPNGAEVHASSALPALDKRIEPLGPFLFSDSWTGIGEIMAMHKLTEMASGAGYRIRPVRGRALTWADIKGANVIFIGSPWANDMQTKFNIGKTPFLCFGTEKIVNSAPAPGEPAVWYSEVNPATNELAATYALFSMLPGAGAGTRMVSSSGIDTYATMAALDLMTTPPGVRDLMQRFGTADKQTLPDYFQAVVRTEIIRGEPARSSIVAVRAVKP